MNSRILKIASQVLKPLFLVVSLWLLLRGHNHPGGGFIAGLIAGSALVFEPLSTVSPEKLRRQWGDNPYTFLVMGMTAILISAFTGLIADNTVLEAQWVIADLPLMQESLKVGTPMLFELGIYFAVIGFIYLVIISMMEEWQWN